jgi:hypothetical protein
MKRQLILWLGAVTLVFFACQKELSFEGSNTPAEGSLQSDVSGDCLPKTVNGTYVALSPLVPVTNTITVQVNVTKTGTYTIGTDTVNGYYFRGTGTFTTLGANTITLRGNGTPFAANVDNFVVSFNGTVCDIQVTVLPAGSGPAVFTLVNGGAPANCASAVVTGTYSNGIALVAANNYVDITVNVTQLGTYTITATGGGMTFSKSGTFTVTGNQTVRLDGSGTPTTTGANTITFAAPFASCNFTCIVIDSVAAVFTLDGNPGACSNAIVNGFYVAQTALGAGNTVVLNVTVTTAGTYPALSTSPAVNGMTFSAPAGSLALGAQTITLTGSGTPTAAGDFSIPFTAGGTTCNFNIHVLPNDYFPRTTFSNWSYEFDNVSTDSVVRYVKNVGPVMLGGNQYTIFMQDDGTGEDSSGYYRRNGGDYFEFFDIGDFIGYDNPLWDQYTMLKDNVALNTVWKSPASGGYAGTVSGQPLNIRFSYKILQKDVPLTVNASTGNVTYPNVIVVEERYEAEISPGVWQDITSVIDFYGKSYYARGIGLIQYESLNAANAVTFLMELRRFYVY